MGCDDGGTTKDSGKLFCALLNLGFVAIPIFSAFYKSTNLMYSLTNFSPSEMKGCVGIKKGVPVICNPHQELGYPRSLGVTKLFSNFY
jgi:hypothetical protein